MGCQDFFRGEKIKIETIKSSKVSDIKRQTDIKRFRSENFDIKESFHIFEVFVEIQDAALTGAARDSLNAFGNKRGGYGFRLKSPRDILPSTNDPFHDRRSEERRDSLSSYEDFTV